MADDNHLLTVSAEDYYHVSAFRQVISPRHWPRFEARFARNTARVLAAHFGFSEIVKLLKDHARAGP